MTRSDSGDCGHYVEVPVPAGAEVVKAGESRRVIALTGGIHLDGTDGISLRTLEDMDFVLEAGARLDLCLVILPGANVGTKVGIDLVGEDASVSLSGVYICGGEQEVSVGVQMRHKVGHCRSKQYFAGVLAGHSKSSFNGRIVVAPDASGTEAYQENHNLLASDGAVAQTLPQLEIYTDDVACSHGATVGRLNEEEQFYMRSRGIPEAEARVLQMVSFVAPALGIIPEGTVREALEKRIEDELRAI